MSPNAEPETPVAIVCGTDSLVGTELVSRLRDERWRIVMINPPGAVEHDAAKIRLHGPLEEPATWQALRERLRDDGLAPRAFIHAITGRSVWHPSQYRLSRHHPDAPEFSPAGAG